MIISLANSTSYVNESFSYKIEATNDPVRYETSKLPPGLFLDPTNGLISGKPTIDGTYLVTIRAINGSSVNSANLTIRVNHKLVAPPRTAKYFGYNAPFLGGKENIFTRQVDSSLVKNDLLQLLLTSPGERVMNLGFGSPIRSFLFENIDQNELDRLSEGINKAIETYEKRVEVDDIIITPDQDRNFISIQIYGRIKNINISADLLIEFDVAINNLGEFG